MFIKNAETNEWEEVYLPPTGDTLPIGFIGAYGGEQAPTNWLICDGTAYNKTDYPELYEAIGTAFNEENDGENVFRVPDLRNGKVPVGFGGDGPYSLGATGGEEEHTLTVEEMPSHSHKGLSWLGNEEIGAISLNSGDAEGYHLSYAGNTAATQKDNIHTNHEGGSQPHNNMPPYVATNYIIKAKQSVGLVGNITNEKSSSDKDTYSCDYINKSETYSSDEIKTSKVWIDGNPIYRKVVDVGNLPNTNVKEIKHNLDINTPIRCFGVCFSNDGISKFTLPISNIYLWLNETNIIVSTTTDRSAYTAKVIIEYTKTTD